MAKLLPESEMEYCGCCCCYHRKDYCGDCRNDKERYIEADNGMYCPFADFDFSTQTPKAENNGIDPDYEAMRADLIP